MSNSLIVSLLLLCAVVILIVLGAELLRNWRLRKDRVTVPAEAARPKARGPGAAMSPANRLEPELDALTIPAAQRAEPDLGAGGRSEPSLGTVEATGLPTLTERGHLLASESGLPDGVAIAAGLSTAPRPVAAMARSDAQGIDRMPAPAIEIEADPPSLAGDGLPMAAGGVGLDGPAAGAAESPQASAPSVPSVPQRVEEIAADEGPTHLTVLNSFTDCIVDLACASPVPGEKLVGLAQAFRRCGTKPVTIEVSVPAGDRGTARIWRTPQASDLCRALRVGVLLDNRSGPLNAMEFSEFLARTQELADRIGAQYKAPILSEVLLAARRLDSDCAQLDCTASISVEVDEVLGPSQLAALAGPLAIIERGNNRYARLTADGEAAFSVFLGDRPNRLCFLLDLPRVSSPIGAWQQMVECARVASRRLSGSLVDGGGRPLTEKMIEGSAANVRQRAFALEAAGLKPGSPLALRVFNG